MVKVKKPFWKKLKFWTPVVTGFIGGVAYAISHGTGVAIPEMILTYIIAAALQVISIIVGVEWNALDDATK